jgi:hypothetical protein
MNNLESHVLRLIGEDISSPDVFTNDTTGLTQIRDSLNDGIQGLCLASGLYTRTYHLALLENRQFYRLAPMEDYYGYVIEAFDRENRRRLRQIDLLSLSLNDPGFMKTGGPVTHYMQVGLDHIGFWRYPTSKGVVIELNCVCIPAAYATSSNVVKIRQAYQRSAVYYAVSEFYASRGDATRANDYLKNCIETAGMMYLHPQQAESQWQMKGNNDNAIRNADQA